MTTPDPFEALTLEQLRQRRSVKWATVDADVLPLWVAEMDTPLAPPIQETLHAAIARSDTGYTTSGELPAAFSAFAKRRYDWRPPTTPILVADVMTGVDVALATFTDPGDKVVISTPAYPPFFTHITHLGRQPVSSPLAETDGKYRLDLDRLERDFAAGARAYLLCNPHNPTGLVFTREELTAIGQLADRYHVSVVADEIHAPLTRPGLTHIPFATTDSQAAATGFTAHAASKAWNLPGLKSALLIPGPDADTSGIHDDLWAGAGLLGALASFAAFHDGEPWLDTVRAGIARRAELLATLLPQRIPHARYHQPAGTYLAWIDLRDYSLGADPAGYLLKHARVALANGPSFGAAGFVRLNLATSEAIITAAIDRIAAALHPMS